MDFGLAFFTRDGVNDSEIWATPYYVPPETLFSEPEDFRRDIYALGSSLYHPLTGKPLFDSDSNSLSELKALKSKPPDLTAATALLSAETVALLTRTLRRKPADQCSSYDEFLDHLRYACCRLRRGDRGAPWPGRQALTPLQWGGIAAALAPAGAGLWKWSNSGSTGNLTPSGGGLVKDNGPTTGADSSISSKFLAARAALCEGNFAADPADRQPTLNWARYADQSGGYDRQTRLILSRVQVEVFNPRPSADAFDFRLITS